MIRRVLLAMMVVVLTLGLSGCIVRRVPNGPDRTETRDVSGFEKISISGYGNMLVKQGKDYSFEVTGAGDVLDELDAEVRGDTLYIEWDQPHLTWFRGFGNPDLSMVVTVPDLERISVSGAGEVTVDGLKTSEFEFELAGAGQLYIDDLDAEKLTIDLSGAGAAEVAGKVTDQDVTISGAGAYDGRDLQSESARVEMSGAGSAIVWAEDSLDVDLSGAGSVEYYGAPDLTQNISGLGSVSGRGSR